MAPGDDDRPAGAQRLERVIPGRLADRLEHGIDPDRQAAARLDRADGAELERLGALLLAPARHVHRDARRAAEEDRRGRDAAARSLDEHRLARLQVGATEEHAVRGEVGGRQARGLGEREEGRLGDEIP